MKLLLYCTKSKPYLLRIKKEQVDFMCNYKQWLVDNQEDYKRCAFNGTIVAECDFEVEKFDFMSEQLYKDDVEKYNAEVDKLNVILKKSCLSACQMVHYLDTKALGTENTNGMIGYAIHIKNLHIFDKPRELREFKENYHIYDKFYDEPWAWHWVDKAPQNMMYVYDRDEKKIIISIRPEQLCKILNCEKTIEVRKKILKEML